MTDRKELVERLTRPILGIENRTSQEAFDMMCDRFTRAIAALSEQEKPVAAGPVAALREALEKIARSLDDRIAAYRCSCTHPCDDYFVFPGPCGARNAESLRNIKIIADAALASPACQSKDGGSDA